MTRLARRANLTWLDGDQGDVYIEGAGTQLQGLNGNGEPTAIEYDQEKFMVTLRNGTQCLFDGNNKLSQRRDRNGNYTNLRFTGAKPP